MNIVSELYFSCIPPRADTGARREGVEGREKPKVQIHLIKLCSIGGILLKVRDVIKVIEADGWYLVTTKGSHRQYKHHVKSGRITIAGHPADDLAPGTMNSIFKQAKIKE